MTTLKKLREAITDIANIAEASGGKKAGSDVRLLNDMLAKDDNEPALSAIDELERDIADPAAPLRQSYIERLEAAGTDQDAFNQVFDTLKSDRQIKKDDLDKIAHAYVWGRERWPSKKSALEAIERRFIQSAYNESKMRIVDRTRVW